MFEKQQRFSLAATVAHAANIHQTVAEASPGKEELSFLLRRQV